MEIFIFTLYLFQNFALVKSFLIPFFAYYLPSRYLLVQDQKWKHQKNVWNQLKINNKDTRRRHWPRSGVFIGNYKYNLHIVLLFPLLL